jgi:dTDP-D-glucose 4,6-dehydratase
MIIPEFIKQFKKIGNKKKFQIHGTGQEVRSFIYIDDFISGFAKIYKKGRNLEIYNIGTSEKIKIRIEEFLYTLSLFLIMFSVII